MAINRDVEIDFYWDISNGPAHRRLFIDRLSMAKRFLRLEAFDAAVCTKLPMEEIRQINRKFSSFEYHGFHK